MARNWPRSGYRSGILAPVSTARLPMLAALLERSNRQGPTRTIVPVRRVVRVDGYPLYYTLHGGQPPARAGVRHATVVPYGAYRCGDGDQGLLAVQTEAQWISFCRDVCGHPEWIDEPRFNTVSGRRINGGFRWSRRSRTSFATETRAEIARKLAAANIPSGDLNSVQQFADHPQLTRPRNAGVGREDTGRGDAARCGPRSRSAPTSWRWATCRRRALIPTISSGNWGTARRDRIVAHARAI